MVEQLARKYFVLDDAVRTAQEMLQPSPEQKEMILKAKKVRKTLKEITAQLADAMVSSRIKTFSVPEYPGEILVVKKRKAQTPKLPSRIDEVIQQFIVEHNEWSQPIQQFVEYYVSHPRKDPRMSITRKKLKEKRKREHVSPPPVQQEQQNAILDEDLLV